jgi:type VI secretion system protein VasG
MFGQAQVRTGYLVIGMLQSKHLYNALIGISRQFDASSSIS